MAGLLRDGVVGKRRLLAVALLLELHVAHQQHRRQHAVDGCNIASARALYAVLKGRIVQDSVQRLVNVHCD